LRWNQGYNVFKTYVYSVEYSVKTVSKVSGECRFELPSKVDAANLYAKKGLCNYCAPHI